MPVDRRIFKTPFYKGSPPQWPCPTCGKGVLKGENSSWIKNELKSSADVHGHEDFEPEWIEYIYSCIFICTNPNCGEKIASVGIGSVEEDVEFDESGSPDSLQYTDNFRPKFFQPNLNIFNIPAKTPDNIRSEIINSFKLFFASPPAASNNIRMALELILDYLKIKKFDNKQGKRIFISLHQRIWLLPKKLNDFKEYFFAIKWLGNTGSHPSKITIDDVMDAYDILETILNEIFEKRTISIKSLVKKINKKKGPKN